MFRSAPSPPLSAAAAAGSSYSASAAPEPSAFSQYSSRPSMQEESSAERKTRTMAEKVFSVQFSVFRSSQSAI